MSEPEPTPTNPRRLIATVLVIALIAAGAGTAGWWLSVLRESMLNAEAVTAATLQCDVAMRQMVAGTVKRDHMITFHELFPIVGTNRDGTFVGNVPGRVTVTSDRKSAEAEFRCLLSDYDSSARRWGKQQIVWVGKVLQT